MVVERATPSGGWPALLFGLTCNRKVAYSRLMIDVFHAVGDPTRRELLERLRRDGPQSLSELARGLPMTRQAVTKHLDLLEEAELVRRRVEGRRRMHELRGAPLRALDDWLAPFEAEWDERLGRLRAHLRRGADDRDSRRGGTDG